MVTIEHAFLIPAKIDKVFTYLANPANDAGWQLSCKHSELLDSTPRVGSKYEIGFSFIGREMSFKGEITHLVPNELYAFKVVEGPFHYTVLTVSSHIRKVRGLNGCLRQNQVAFLVYCRQRC